MSFNFGKGAFQIGVDPERERAGLRLTAEVISSVKFFLIESRLNELRRQNSARGDCLWQQVRLLEQQLEIAKREKMYATIKSKQVSEEHEKLFQGTPRIILTVEEKDFLEANLPQLKGPGLSYSRSYYEELVCEALIIGVSLADSDYNRPPEPCPYCGSRNGDSLRGLIR